MSHNFWLHIGKSDLAGGQSRFVWDMDPTEIRGIPPTTLVQDEYGVTMQWHEFREGIQGKAWIVSEVGDGAS